MNLRSLKPTGMLKGHGSDDGDAWCPVDALGGVGVFLVGWLLMSAANILLTIDYCPHVRRVYRPEMRALLCLDCAAYRLERDERLETIDANFTAPWRAPGGTFSIQLDV